MTEYINAIILGIVQGVTEFLPISSDGHLEIFKFLLGDKAVGKESLTMTVILHVATTLSIITVFRKDIIEIFSGLFKFENNDEWKFAVNVIISMIPAAIVGLFFEEALTQLFDQRIGFVGLMLVVTGVTLFIANRSTTTDKPISNLNAFIMGISQAIAILPGVSRSGMTIGTAAILGIDKSKAARFSFLMVVPLILGKIAKDLLSDEPLMISNKGAAVAGFIAAYIVGVLTCNWLLTLVRKNNLGFFAYYCIAVGMALFLLRTFHVI
jgi:undecaprenyl-diphosphatase